MSTPNENNGSVVHNELSAEKLRALRTPVGGFVLAFARGVEVALSAAELVSQARCLAKLAAAGIALRRLPRHDFSETWYSAFVRPVIVACDPASVSYTNPPTTETGDMND